MKGKVKQNVGIRLLLDKYRNLFQVPENLNHYSGADYKTAERSFLKYALSEMSICDIQGIIKANQRQFDETVAELKTRALSKS